MTLLLDTHVVLWWRTDAPQLTREARVAIADADHVFVSAVSAWEVAVKTALGRLRLRDPFAALVRHSGFDELPITFRHAAEVAGLPPHHNDPFDRMLVAQARTEKLTLITHDRRLAPYQVAVIWT